MKKMPEKKYDLIKEIRTKYSPETVKLLIEKRIKYEIHVYKDYSPYQTKEEIEEIIPFVEIKKEVYDKIKRISEITGIPLKNIITEEIDGVIEAQIKDEPLVFLDAYLGIENIKDPISLIEKFKDIVKISDKFFEYLKTVDPIEYIEKWYHPSK